MVLVRFASDPRGDGATGANALLADGKSTQWQALKQEFSDTGVSYVSARSLPLDRYVSTVSGGRWEVETVYPQDPDGTQSTVTYLTLPGTLEGYRGSDGSSDYELVRDTLQALQELDPDTSRWDLDGDGAVDNLTIVVQLPQGASAYQSGPFLVPHNSQQPYGSVKGLRVGGNGHYMIVPLSWSAGDSLFLLGAGGETAKHEYLHTAGLGDLYRAGQIGQETGGVPVGTWSVMAQAVRSWPLAQEREWLGWTSIPVLKEERVQEVTLHAPGSGGLQAVRLPSPFDPQDSFVVEYRRKQPSYQGLLDDSLPGSGAIIYRVNTSFDNKHSGRSNVSLDGQVHDAVYVFRDASETAVSGRVPATAALNRSRPSYGSLDLAATLNAVTDSQGRNTGIYVEVLAEGSGTITLRLTRADTSLVSLWEQMGTSREAGAGALALLEGKTPVRAAAGAQEVLVQQWSGSRWESLGTPPSPSPQAPSDLALTVLDGCLLLAVASQQTGRITVSALRDGVWNAVGSVDASLNQPMLLATAASRAYLVAWAPGGDSTVLVWSCDATSLTPAGKVSGSYLTTPWLVSCGGQTLLATTDFRKGTRTFSALRGGVWDPLLTEPEGRKTLGLVESAVGFLDLSQNLSGGDLRLCVRDAAGQVLRRADLSALPASVTSARAALCGDQVCLVLLQGSEVEVVASPLGDLSTWTRLGEKVTSLGDAPELVSTASQVYVQVTAARGGSALTTYYHPAP